MPFDWRSLFSGQGRVNRTTFWTVQLMLALFDACVQATGLLFGVLPVLALGVLLMVLASVIGVLNLAKRLHDLGVSGWWSLALIAIPISIVGAAVAVWGRGSPGALASEGPAWLVGIVLGLGIGVLPGRAGPNRFGEPPSTPAWVSGA